MTEDQVLTKAAGMKALAKVNIGSLIRNVGAGGPALQPVLPQLRRKWKPRKKNLRRPIVTWALGFWTKLVLL